MNGRDAARTAGLLVLVGVLLAGAVRAQSFRERAYPPSARETEGLSVTSGKALRRLTVSFNALAADVYWIRALQHYGSTKRRLTAEARAGVAGASRRTEDYESLYPLLDLTTTLDPRFDIAYRFGAVFLAEAFPAGPGRPDLAVRLLEKGLRERPDKWEYMEDIGFVHYWYRHDYRQAARWFQQASELPGAPVWLKPLAATTLARGGDRRSSRLVWEAILESAGVDWLRREAGRRLVQLRVLDEIEALQRAVDEFGRVNGVPASDWTALVRARVLRRGIPRDPAGTPYDLTRDGRVALSNASPLFPLPGEPDRLEGLPGQ